MLGNLPPQRRYHILDQHNTCVRHVFAPGMAEDAAIDIALGILHADELRLPSLPRVVTRVRVVEFGCDPLTGVDGNFNLGPAPGGGYIVSRLVYDSDDDVDHDRPFYKFLAAIRKAVEDYDLTKDHDPRHSGVTDHDCVRCHIVACLPPGERPARDRKKTA